MVHQSPRKSGGNYRGIAQLVEQRSPKPRAEGSSPSAPARTETDAERCPFLFCKRKSENRGRRSVPGIVAEVPPVADETRRERRSGRKASRDSGESPGTARGQLRALLPLPKRKRMPKGVRFCFAVKGENQSGLSVKQTAQCAVCSEERFVGTESVVLGDKTGKDARQRRSRRRALLPLP